MLSDNELRLAWWAAHDVGPPFGQLMQILILTAQRRDEVGKMIRSEIDWREKIWTIPGPRAKNRKASEVPLSIQAEGILIDWVPRIDGEAGYLFTTTGTSPFSGFSKCKKRLDELMLAMARREAVHDGEDPDKISIAPWRLHDLRRTTTTGLAKRGVPVHVGEAVLNHRSGKVSGIVAVYNRYQYLEEKRDALQTWADHLMSLIGHCPAEDVSVSAPDGKRAPLDPWTASIARDAGVGA